MRNTKKAWVVSAIGLLATLMAAASIAAPTTRPSTKPADANTVEVIAATAHARFRVPKLWKRLTVNGGSPDVVFLFDPAPSKTPKSIMAQQVIELYLDKPKEHQTTLDAIVTDTRKALQHMKPDIKFTKDAAITYVGQPAWTFHWTQQNKVTVTTKGGTTSDDFVSVDRVETVWLQNDTICQLGLHATVRFMPTLAQKAEPVAKSLTWEQ